MIIPIHCSLHNGVSSRTYHSTNSDNALLLKIGSFNECPNAYPLTPDVELDDRLPPHVRGRIAPHCVFELIRSLLIHRISSAGSTASFPSFNCDTGTNEGYMLPVTSFRISCSFP